MSALFRVRFVGAGCLLVAGVATQVVAETVEPGSGSGSNRAISAGIGFPDSSQTTLRIGLGVGGFPDYEGSDSYEAFQGLVEVLFVPL